MNEIGPFEQMQMEIAKLVDIVVKEHTLIKGVIISTHEGKPLYSYFRKDELSENEAQIAASTTSILFIANNMFEKLLNQNIKYTTTRAGNLVLICLLTKSITGAVFFDRELVELSGINFYKKIIEDLLLKISAIIETSELIKEDLFVLVKRAIPDALAIGIINKDGLPIRIESSMEAPTFSAFIYALYQLANVIMKNNAEYITIGGTSSSFIIKEIDESRILGIAIPESDEQNLGKYLVKLENIIREFKI
ncbi:MAG: hypothetical protein ACTSRZ_09340 [Promethearchaeota archaeon]